MLYNFYFVLDMIKMEVTKFGDVHLTQEIRAHMTDVNRLNDVRTTQEIPPLIERVLDKVFIT